MTRKSKLTIIFIVFALGLSACVGVQPPLEETVELESGIETTASDEVPTTNETTAKTQIKAEEKEETEENVSEESVSEGKTSNEATTNTETKDEETNMESEAISANNLTEAQEELLLALKSKGVAPPLENEIWLNTSPLNWNDLRGKVVIVEFWTYG